MLACRDTEKAKQIAANLKKTTSNRHIYVESLDLASLDHIANFAEKFQHSGVKSVYALVNNAAIFYAKPQSTVDNLDVTYQTNFLGQFLLTLLLIPYLRRHQGEHSRIVFLSSEAHLHSNDFPRLEFHQPYEDTPENRFAAYQYSKFCLMVFAYRLKKCLGLSNIDVFCVDPGNTETKIYRTFPQLSDPLLFALQKPIRFFLVKTPKEAAQNCLHALQASNPSFYIQNLNTSYWFNYRISNQILADVLWQQCRKTCEKYLTSGAADI